MVEGMTIVLGQGSLSRRSDMGKNEARGRLGGNAMKVGAVPSGYGGRE